MPTNDSYYRRDLSYLKPAKFQNHLSLKELCWLVGKDESWIKKLERAGRIPRAARVSMGELQIRLWSPAQVAEIQKILSEMKVGRPKGS